MQSEFLFSTFKTFDRENKAPVSLKRIKNIAIGIRCCPRKVSCFINTKFIFSKSVNILALSYVVPGGQTHKMESKASVASVKPLLLAILLVCSYTLIEATANVNDESSNSLNKTNMLPVTIYYEALCSDSMVFITNQLYPFWLRHEKEMKLRLVPFGKAWVEEQPNEPPKFHCQHGARECQLNILHGCILQKLPPKKAFTVVACLMKNFRTDFEQCIEGHESFRSVVVNCSQGPQGGKLFKKFANETDAVHRPLPFVPTIVGDQPYDFYEQDDWLQHFERKFAERYEAKFGVKL